MMGFWTAIVIICTLGIGTEFVVRVVKIGARHYENIARIRRGYPTLDGALPLGYEAHEPVEYSDNSSRLQ